MLRNKSKFSFLILFGLLCSSCKQTVSTNILVDEIANDYPHLITQIVDLKTDQLDFYLLDEHGENFKNFERLETWLQAQDKVLVFAMNGGMYNKDLSPQGLYIENGKTLAELDTLSEGYGNFYLQPNGVFSIDEAGKANISTSIKFRNKGNIKYATQSGPMLVIDQKIHPKLTEGSENVHIRNGVGLLPDGRLLFAMSKEKINFYDFAKFFKDNACKNALYLDGFVSRTYLPSKNWIQKDGNFGVIIAQVK